jgi:hypothetical protein
MILSERNRCAEICWTHADDSFLPAVQSDELEEIMEIRSKHLAFLPAGNLKREELTEL